MTCESGRPGSPMVMLGSRFREIVRLRDPRPSVAWRIANGAGEMSACGGAAASQDKFLESRLQRWFRLERIQ